MATDLTQGEKARFALIEILSNETGRDANGVIEMLTDRVLAGLFMKGFVILPIPEDPEEVSNARD